KAWEIIMKKLWPDLKYEDWKDTYHTLHRYLQVIGKLRIYKSPWLNHSWHATYYVNSRGLTTSAIPLEDRNLTIQFDFHHHEVIFEDSRGRSHSIPLQSQTVAAFYEKFLDALSIMEVSGYINDYPVECMDNVPFSEDEIRKSYNPEQVQNFFQVLVLVNNVFEKFRSEFIGKTSPSHLFWGSFDLAVTRFSGRKAPEHPGIAPHVSPIVMKEAYSHEVCSVGFWPGSEAYPHTIFYSYAYPEPEGFRESVIENAFYNEKMGEFMLHYDDVQKSDYPENTLMNFLQSSYQKVSELGDWKIEKLEENSFLYQLSKKYQNKTN